MAKQDTINVAGRDVDLVELINTGIDKSQLWEQYQQLLGDEVNDFRTALNEINLNLADGVYYFNKYGRIIDSRTNKGITEEYNYYRESDGTKKDGAGKWYNSRRRGFNPYGNVETYLNGVAKIVNTPKKEEPESNKKKWTSSTKNTLLGNAIFGEGNELDPSKNSAQLEAWANTLDKSVNGVRGTSERRKYLWDNILKPYRDTLTNGDYDIDDESKNKEITALNEIENNLDNDWLLGKYSPLLTSYLFTGEKYLTPKQQEENKASEAIQKARDAYINGESDDYSNTGWSAEELGAAYSKRVNNKENKWLLEFDSYTSNATDINNIKVPKSSAISNMTQWMNVPIGTAFQTLKNYPISCWNYFSQKEGKEVNGLKYIPDFKNGRIYIVRKDSNDNIYLSINNLQKIINNSKTLNKDLYNYLYEEWKNYNNYSIELYKLGGILKASNGTQMKPQDDPKEEQKEVKPQPASTPDTSATVPQLKTIPYPSRIQRTSEPWIDNSSPNVWMLNPKSAIVPFNLPGSTPKENTEVRGGNYVISPSYDPFKTKHPADIGLDILNSYRQFSNKLANIKSRDELLALQGVHVNPYRLERLIHSSKRFEDAIALNNAKYGLLGKQLASGTANNRLGMAALLNAFDKVQSQNAPIISQNAQVIMDLTDKTVENENNNFVRDWETQQKNHQADVALHNYKHQLMAEYYNRQGRYDDAVLQEMQRGIAQGAMENFEEQLKFAIANDPNVINALKKLYDLLERQQKGEQISELEINLARFNYNKTISDALIKNSPMYLKRPRGYTYAPYLFVYIPQISSPVPIDKQGGKLLAAEEEKTKRMYAKMLFDMMKMDTQHLYKLSRDAYKDYRKIFMQQNK